MLQGEQPSGGDLLFQRERVTKGKYGILGAMNHERRDVYLAEPVADRLTRIHGEVICHARRDVDGTIDVATHEITHSRFVEVAPIAREHSQQADDVVDHGLPIRPVGVLASADVGKELLRHGRKVRATRARPDQGE
jgi:hypothetical protein